MDIVVALVGLAILVIVAVYVAQPFITRSRTQVPVQESPRDRLLAERDAIYAAIRDLDMDFQTGKLLEADYRAMRDKYMARGVEILKELDVWSELERKSEVGGGRSEVGSRRSEVGDEIEAAVQARRRARTQARSLDVDIEAAIRSRRKSEISRQPSAIGNLQCPSCGRPVDPTDRFCARCGVALTVEASR